MIKLAVRSIRGHLARFMLTVVAVTLGVAFVAGTFILTDTMGSSVAALQRSSAEGIDVYVRLDVKALTASGPGTTGERKPPELAKIDFANELSGIKGVAEAYPELGGMTVLVKEDGTAARQGSAPTVAMMYRASDTQAKIVEGQAPQGEQEVVLERKTATTAGASVGSTVTLLVGNNKSTPKVVGLAEVRNAGGTMLVYFDRPTAEKLYAPDGKVASFVVRGDGSRTQDELRADVAKQLPTGYEAITGATKADEGGKQAKDGLRFVNMFLLIFAGVSLTVGAFIIVNTFQMVLTHRAQELAVLRALGSSRAQVVGLVLLEAAVIGLLGGVGGLVIGVAVAGGLTTLMQQPGMEFAAPQVAGRTMAISVGLGLGMTCLSAVVPAVAASGIPPLAAMREQDANRPRTAYVRSLFGLLVVAGAAVATSSMLGAEGTRRHILLGGSAALWFFAAVILSAGLVFLLIGLPTWPLRSGWIVGRLARENTLRSPQRTSITASALMVGLGLVCAVAVVTQSAVASVERTLDEGMVAELVMVDASGTMSVTVANGLTDIPGVASVATLAAVPVKFFDKDAFAMGVDATELSAALKVQMSSGQLSALDRGEAVVPAPYAKKHNLTVGSELAGSIGTLQGQNIKVGGIYANSSLLSDNLVIPAKLAKDAVPQDQRVASGVLVKLAPGADEAAVRKELTEDVKSLGTVSVQNKREFTAQNTGPIEELQQLVLALLSFSVLIASLGIVNTLIMSIMERTREIGLLRAVGMERRELWQMITVESTMTALFGSVLGVALGLGLGVLAQRALAPEGLSVLVIPWGTVLGLLVMTAIIGVIAAVVPAYRATKINVLAAIAHS